MTDIEIARYYAKRRMEKEEQLTREMLQKYLYAFSRVLQLAYSSGVPPTRFTFEKNLQLNNKVDKVMNRLVADLYNIIENFSFTQLALAQAKNDREEDLDIVAFINRPINGKDINGRLAEYSENAKLEFEAYVAAGLLLSKPINAVLSEYKTYFNNPYGSPLVKATFGLKVSEIASKRLLTRGVSFGAGKYIASFSAFNRLGLGTTDFAFNYADNEYMRRNGALGYQVYRGSSYPCEACDSNTGFHPISDQSLPVHSRCLCFAVPVFTV